MSTQKFTVQVEAEIVRREQTSLLFPHSDDSFPWRSIVRIGSQMHWQWHRTRDEAKGWIEAWKTKAPVVPTGATTPNYCQKND